MVLDRRLPKETQDKAFALIEDIQRGSHWGARGGKRLAKDRTLISVPIGPRYRLIFRDTNAPSCAQWTFWA